MTQPNDGVNVSIACAVVVLALLGVVVGPVVVVAIMAVVIEVVAAIAIPEPCAKPVWLLQCGFSVNIQIRFYLHAKQ